MAREAEGMRDVATAAAALNAAAALAKEKGSPAELLTDPSLLRQHEVMQLLQNPNAAYDNDHALMLVQRAGFRPGQLYLYEKLSMQHMVVQHYMESGEDDRILQLCKEKGRADPGLWVRVLANLAAREDGCTEQIRNMLRVIDEGNILPPLVVVQTLASNRSVSLGVVHDYIRGCLLREQLQISEDASVIEQLRADTERMKTEVLDLRTKARIFQRSTCSHCTAPLELPAVHFLCMHSFHQNCVLETERECPKCAPEQQRVMAIQADLQASAGSHENFLSDLQGSSDGFSVVADYLGKNVFADVEEGATKENLLREREKTMGALRRPSRK
jgi:hypothetical protein